MRIALFRTFQTYTVSQQYLVFNDILNPITNGGGVFRTRSNFAALTDPRKDKYIEMFHADFSYLSTGCPKIMESLLIFSFLSFKSPKDLF